MISIKGACLIILLLGLSGCAGNQHIIAEPASGTESGYVGLQPSQVTVYSSEKDAPKDRVVLAKLKSTGDFCCDARNQLIEAFQEKAAECGANGVIILEITTESKDVLAEKAPKDSNDLSPHNSPDDKLAPVTWSQRPLLTNLSPGKIIYKGYALAVKVPIKYNWGFE